MTEASVKKIKDFARDTSKLNYAFKTKLPVAFKLSDISDKVAYDFFLDYFIGSLIFTHPKRYDFHGILVHLANDMHYSKSNAIPASVRKPSSSSKFKVSKSVKTFEMKKEFLDRLSNTGYVELFIDRSEIDSVFYSLPKDYQDIILYFIRKKEKALSDILKGLKKSTLKKIEPLHRNSKRLKLKSAIRLFIEALKRRQGD